MGSDFLRGIQAWSSSRSLRQISRWSTPAPAVMCSPDSSIMHCTMGSDLARRLRPSTSLGRSAGFLGSTATLTTGDTENFICFMLCASLRVEMVPVLTRNKVRSHDPGLLSSGHLAGEDTAEGVEPSLVGGRHHLGHVHHQWGLGVTVLDAHAGSVVVGSLVEELSPVLLGGDGGGEVDDDHLEHSIASRQPVPHHTLHQGLSLQLLLLGLEHILDQLAGGSGELAQKLLGLLLLEVHDGIKDHVDGVQDIHAEGAFVVVGLLLAPLLCLGVEEGLTPQLLHHLVSVDTKLGGVHLSKLLEGESPPVQSGAKADGAVVDVHPDHSHRAVVVGIGGHDDVNVLNDPLEGLEKLLLAKLQLKESTVHLVHEENGPDPLGNGLPQHGLSLDTDTRDTVDNDKSSVGDTEGSGHFAGEVNVAGGIDQVDEETWLVGAVLLLGNGLLDESQILLIHVEEHGDSCGLDGDAPILLVLPSVGGPGLPSL